MSRREGLGVPGFGCGDFPEIIATQDGGRNYFAE
jgi:hypothetical protein